MQTSRFNLYEHNQIAADKINELLDLGELIIAILHATGSGKTYISLDVIDKHPNKKILFVTRYNSIIEHIESIIDNYPNIDIKEYLKNVRFITYSSLVNLTRKELAELDVDILMTDEFHHVGAPVWQTRIETIKETHPNLQIVGLSAYSVRDRGTAYERDMAEPGGDELFSDKVCSFYSLVDAMLDGVLPIPRYKTAITIILSFIDQIEDKVKRRYSINHPSYSLYINTLNNLRRKINLSMGMDELIKRNINIGDKFLYFCPPSNGREETNIDKIMADTKEKLISLGYKEEDIVFYKSTVKMPDRGRESRNAFYNDIDLSGHDVSKKLRIMFSINQYNEGVHVPNLDGVILGRGTKSDIVFFEQIGRALAIRGHTKEKIAKYKSLSREELLEICRYRDIKVNEHMTNDDIIERIVSPVIIDLAGNFTYIRDLIKDLKDRIRMFKESNGRSRTKKYLDLTDEAFDIEIIGESIFNILEGLNNSFKPRNFDEIYSLASNFYHYYNHLNIPRNFKTDDGVTYSEFGYSLGEWLAHIRSSKNKGELTREQIEKLERIGIIWRLTKTWEEAFALAKEYYELNGHLNIPSNYKTKDGYSLGLFIAKCRHQKKIGLLTKEQIAKLESIGMVWQRIQTFAESYELAKKYFTYYGTINMETSFPTFDGITYNPDGFDLKEWVNNQIDSYHKGKLSEEKIKLLEMLNIEWGEKKVTEPTLSWDDAYNLATAYYNYYGNLKIKRDFKTKNGITYDKKGYSLGRWISRQQVNKKKGKLTSTQIALLDQIGMVWQSQSDHKTWNESYAIAKKFYEAFGTLNVPTTYRTEDGYNLSSFLYLQRRKRLEGALTEEQIHLLDCIGMIWNLPENYATIKEELKYLGLNPRKYAPQLKHLSLLEFQAKLNFIKTNNLPILIDNQLNSIFTMTSVAFKDTYDIQLSSLISNIVTHKKD